MQRISCGGHGPQPDAPIPETVSAAILKRLAAEGVRSLKDWQKLGPRRLVIFGITSRVVAQLDALARAAI